MPKCLLCFSEHVFDNEDEHMPFRCSECGAWGLTIDDISSPHEVDDGYRTGQVNRVPTDDPEDVFVPGWA